MEVKLKGADNSSEYVPTLFSAQWLPILCNGLAYIF